jgi:hypothetical protein
MRISRGIKRLTMTIWRAYQTSLNISSQSGLSRVTDQQLTKVYDINLTLRPRRHKYPTLLLLFHLLGALRLLLIVPLEPAVRVVK